MAPDRRPCTALRSTRRFEDALAAYRTQGPPEPAPWPGKLGELSGGVPRRRWTNTNPIQRAMEFMEELPEPDWGRRLRHEIQIALIRRSYRKSRGA